MPNDNTALHRANRAKKDEFYTRIDDISNELHHYKEFFRDKTVLCNCDDPYESNFFKYFALKFNEFHLRKLIATCYAGSPVQETELPLFNDRPTSDTPDTSSHKKPYKVVITAIPDADNDGAVDLSDVKCLLRNDKNVLETLQGDGDFQSRECIELLKEADVVVTNPPFSLFREYVAQLVRFDKKFLIIGNQNAITYKEIFPLIKENKLWLGVSIHSGDRKFYVPDAYQLNAANCGIDSNGRKYIRVKGVRWFTNIDTGKRHERMLLYKRYNPDEYPKYDNYDAINVDRTADIPIDYDGVMGVPITFLDKYCPEQFEILGITERGNGYGLRTKVYTRADSKKYSDWNCRATIIKNGVVTPIYARILIKAVHSENAK